MTLAAKPVAALVAHLRVEVEAVVARGAEGEDEVEEGDRRAERLDELEEGARAPLLLQLLLGEHAEEGGVLRHEARIVLVPPAEARLAKVGEGGLGALVDHKLAEGVRVERVEEDADLQG